MDWEASVDSNSKGGLYAFTESRRTSDIFTRVCAEYRRGLLKNSADLAKANGSESRPFESFLYNPACFVTFGINDCMAIVAIDDFDPAFRLASDPEIPVRQTCLAFCPRLDSLGLMNHDSAFVELHNVCNARLPEMAESRGESVSAPTLSFLEDRPLVAMTYFKLNGMAILGPGLLMQQAIYKVMADTIERTLERLDIETDLGQHSGNKHADICMSNENVKSFRCSFLDPQGWADIATIMFCQNYSVIGSVLADLREISFAQLYKKEDALEEAVENFGIHKMISGRGNRSSLLSDNHVFWSVYTTLGITHEAFEEKLNQPHRYSGVVIPDTHLKIYPGHIGAVREAAPSQYDAHKKKVELKDPACVWPMIGHNDFLFEQLVNEKHEIEQVVRLSEILEQAKCMRVCRGKKKPKLRKKGRKHVLEHILDAYTDIRVPVPISSQNGKERNKLAKKPGHRYIPFDFEKIRDGLFGKDHALCIHKLRDKMRALRIPAPLSESIIYLFSDFARYVCYPFIFESVLDLFDIFRATYMLLTERLPKTLKDNCEHDHQCRAFMGVEEINSLLVLVELLQDALNNRIQVIFPEAERWNVTIDVRGGGLHRWVNATDTLLKCGLTVLWRIASGWTDVYLPTEEDKRSDRERNVRVAGALRISQNPRALAQRIEIGRHPDVFLASVNLNVSHLVRPSALHIHLHETAHLVLDLVQRQSSLGEKLVDRLAHAILQRNLNPAQRERYLCTMMERYEDVFAEMFVHYFLYPDKDEYITYFRNYVANYSFDPVACCRENKNAFLRMFEVMIRGFLVTDPFRVRNEDRYVLDRNLYADYSLQKMNPETVGRACERFWYAVEDAGPFFFEFDRLWPEESNKEGRQYVSDQFSLTYTESYELVCDIWSKINRIHEGISKGRPDEGKFGIDPPLHVDRDCIEKQIKEGLANGKPLSRSLQVIPGYADKEERFKYLNSFFLLKQLLKEHIKGILGPATVNTKTQRVLLDRRPGDGWPDFDRERLPQGKIGWHAQMIDRNSNRLFTVGPAAREQYMISRIAVIKTLWDISTNFRARRMKDMLELSGTRQK
jgi:hypothetical protein